MLGMPVRMIPILLPLLAILYWMWRIKYRKNFRALRIRGLSPGEQLA
jgi:hypothetical protein